MVANGFETTMKEALDRSESRRMQREQERERRRIRDRQRRQSMSVEQRERHLARRRRNYQLRRLRAENAKGDFPSQQISNEHGGGMIDVQEITQIEKLSVVENTEFSECLEATVSKLANFPKRLRLSHIRRLARSLNRLGGEVIGNHQVVSDVITKADANGSSCIPTGDCDSSRLPAGLRFNRVKRLARALNTATNDTFVTGQKVEQNPSLEEVIIGDNNKPECGESISVVGEVEGPTMDG